jgi:SIR2-like domain
VTVLERSPYKFLAPYEERDEELFFGRKQETEILLADVVIGRLVVLFAKTGTGKTSLINAGVRPALRRRGYTTFYIRVRRDPAQSARIEIENRLGHRFDEEASFAAQLEDLARSLRQPVVLFFDQFEEFFIDVARHDWDAAEQFIADLADLYQNEASGVHIMLSMREEFFGALNMFRDEIPTIFHEDANVQLRWFDDEQARAAITGPAEAVGLEIEPALVNQLIADLTESGSVLAGATPTKPIEPAQLQIVCDTLWGRRQGGRIQLDHYFALGRAGRTETIAQQILDQRLEEEFAKIPGRRQLELLERLLPELGTEHKTKRVWDFLSLLERLQADERDLGTLLDQLDRSHLIARSPRDGADFVELTHDYLVERLKDLQRGVRALVARRIVEEATEAARQSPEGLLDVNSVMMIIERPDELDLQPDESVLLLRSAVKHRIDLRRVLDPITRTGPSVWSLLQDIVDTGDEQQAGQVVDWLARQASTESLALLQRTLRRTPLAGRALSALTYSDSPEAVQFFTAALQDPDLRTAARVTLEAAALSSRPEVAEPARSALATPPSTAPSERAKRRRAPRPVATPTAPAPASRRTADSGDSLTQHYRLVAGEILAGRVVPFLGMGVNLCGRPEELTWRPGQFDWLPSGTELSHYLAQMFNYSDKNDDDLVRVSQYVSLMVGAFPLYVELRRLFDGDYPPTPLHRFLADLPAILRAHDPNAPRYQLIVTTNYDDVLERAFLEHGEPFDLVTYDAEGPFRGKFTHRPHGGEPVTIHEPNTYRDLTTAKRTVILKIHGAVDRADESRDSFVITEDHYIDYLARTDVSKLFPVTLVGMLRRSHCLFLGYSLRDWNLRVILNRIWGDDRLRAKSWAVQRSTDRLDRELWTRRDVMLLDVPLEGYVAGLHEALQESAWTGG